MICIWYVDHNKVVWPSLYADGSLAKFSNLLASRGLHRWGHKTFGCVEWRTSLAWWRLRGRPAGAYDPSFLEDTCLLCRFGDNKSLSFRWSRNSFFLLGQYIQIFKYHFILEVNYKYQSSSKNFKHFHIT